MKRIRGEHWDHEIKATLVDAALSGGAIVSMDDNLEVVVIDVRLWESLEARLPSLIDVIREMRAVTKG